MLPSPLIWSFTPETVELMFKGPVIVSPGIFTKLPTAPPAFVMSVELSVTAPARPLKLVTPPEPAGPCGPCGPCGPGLPCNPCGPVLPGEPVEPCGPCVPCNPCGPVGPAGPSGPCDPAGPAGPSGPVAPRSNATHAVPSQTQPLPVESSIHTSPFVFPVGGSAASLGTEPLTWKPVPGSPCGPAGPGAPVGPGGPGGPGAIAIHAVPSQTQSTPVSSAM